MGPGRGHRRRRRRRAGSTIQFRFVKPNGEEIWLRASSTAVTDGPDGRQLQGLVFDITEAMHAQTEHELMEIELRLAQKLEAVGQLAAGIAHEINTPVQFVGDTISFLREAFDDLMALSPRRRPSTALPPPEPSPPSCSSASAPPRSTPTSTTCASASRRPSSAPATASGASPRSSARCASSRTPDDRAAASSTSTTRSATR